MNSILLKIALLVIVSACGAKTKTKYVPVPEKDKKDTVTAVTSDITAGDDRCPNGGQLIKFVYNGVSISEDIVICNSDSTTEIIVDKNPDEGGECKVEVIVNDIKTCVYAVEDFERDRQALEQPKKDESGKEEQAPIESGDEEETGIVEETPSDDSDEESEGDKEPVALDGKCSIRRVAEYTVESHFEIAVDRDSEIDLSDYTVKLRFVEGSAITSIANNNGGNTLLRGHYFQMNPINNMSKVMIYARSPREIKIKFLEIESNGATYRCEIQL